MRVTELTEMAQVNSQMLFQAIVEAGGDLAAVSKRLRLPPAMIQRMFSGTDVLQKLLHFVASKMTNAGYDQVAIRGKKVEANRVVKYFDHAGRRADQEVDYSFGFYFTQNRDHLFVEAVLTSPLCVDLTMRLSLANLARSLPKVAKMHLHTDADLNDDYYDGEE